MVHTCCPSCVVKKLTLKVLFPYLFPFLYSCLSLLSLHGTRLLAHPATPQCASYLPHLCTAVLQIMESWGLKSSFFNINSKFKILYVCFEGCSFIWEGLFLDRINGYLIERAVCAITIDCSSATLLCVSVIKQIRKYGQNSSEIRISGKIRNSGISV